MQRIGDSFVAPGAVLTGDVVLSAGANIWFGCVLRADLARITLGEKVNLQDGVIVHTDHDEPMTLEDGVVVGHRAVLHGRSVGKDSLVGMGARVLPGVSIGEGCTVGAGAVVLRNVPDGSTVVGVPAQAR